MNKLQYWIELNHVKLFYKKENRGPHAARKTLFFFVFFIFAVKLIEKMDFLQKRPSLIAKNGKISICWEKKI